MFFLKKYGLISIFVLFALIFFIERLISYPYTNADQNYTTIYPSKNSNNNSVEFPENHIELNSEKEHPFYENTKKDSNSYMKKNTNMTISDKILIDPTQNLDSISEFKIHNNYKTLSKATNSSLKIDAKKDIYWEFGPSGNYVDLIIRKKPKINSVLLTNMYYGKSVSLYGNKVYGLRSKKDFKVNLNEKRIIGNKTITNNNLAFLVDSTPEKNYIFKHAFRIRLPLQVEYGYKAPGENYGVIFIKKGVLINLRTFNKKYANHSSSFENNSIEIDFTEKDYLKRMKPFLKKLAVYNSNSFKIIKIEYFSRFDYIKYFLIRDIHESQFFRKISFSKKPFQNKTGLVIRAMNQPDKGITMIALIYIKEDNYEKDYEIAAVDQQNRISHNIIHFTNQPKLNEEIYNNTNNGMDQKFDFEKSENSILKELNK